MKRFTVDGTPLSYSEVNRQVKTAVGNLDRWERVFKPLISETVDAMIRDGHLPIKIADTFDDLGNFCQKLAQDIMAERERRKLPLPLGPDDRDKHNRRRRRPDLPFDETWRKPTPRPAKKRGA